jgi:hypothetical protein
MHTLLQAAQIGARQNFVTHGYVSPIALVHARRHPDTGEPLNPPRLMVINLTNVPDKDTLAEALRELLKKTNATAVALINEAWEIAKFRPGEKPQDWVGRVKDHPNAKEIVLINFETRDGHILIVQARIVEKKGKRVLDPFKEQEMNQGSGRFVGLFDHGAKN